MGIQYVAGSVPGGQHKSIMKNNQDAFYVSSRDGLTIAVVADGCGSGKYSEMGAHMGAMVLCHSIRNSMVAADDGTEPVAAMDSAVANAKTMLLNKLRTLFEDCTGDEREIAEMICEYGLFTIICAVVTDSHFGIYAQGDGCFSVRTKGEKFYEICEIFPMEGNMPPYIGYGASNRFNIDRNELVLRKVAGGSRECLESIVIASDGFCTYRDPAKLLAEWMADGKLFGNPHVLQRRLNLLNGAKQKVDYLQKRIDREPHAFGDDCTVVILRDSPSSDNSTGSAADASA